MSGNFIPQQLANVLVEENIAGLTESDESDDEFDDVLYSLIDGEEENWWELFRHFSILFGHLHYSLFMSFVEEWNWNMEILSISCIFVPVFK